LPEEYEFDFSETDPNWMMLEFFKQAMIYGEKAKVARIAEFLAEFITK